MGPTEEDEVNRSLLDDDDDDEAVAAVAVDYRLSVNSYISVFILFIVNLLNYMDRFTLAGVLPDVQKSFDVDDAEGGLLQTVFLCSYMVFAPVCGFLGDRFNRKLIMAAGVFVWTIAVLLSTVVPAHHFWAFLACRALVGIGEASYSTVSPTIIADMFTHDVRSRMLMVFYFAIPVGSGLGYIVGANVAAATGDWRWGARVTPPLGLLSVLLILFVLREPKRGESESEQSLAPTSFLHDLRHLVHNRTYVWSTLGFTCVVFVAGSLSWWTPSAVIYSVAISHPKPHVGEINLVFGAITCVAGFVGISVGSLCAQLWRRTNAVADALVCAIGALGAVPFLFFALNTIERNLAVGWVLVFVSITLLCFNWAIVVDLLLYVVVPTRRATATAFQVMFSHAFGDAFSPYLIGLVSDSLRKNTSAAEHFYSLRYALYVPNFVLVIGGYMFLMSSWHLEYDKKAAEMETQGRKATAAAVAASLSGQVAPSASPSQPRLIAVRPVAVNDAFVDR